MMKPDIPKFALVPCPFCGGPANYDCANNGTEHGVNCANEFCIGYYMAGAEGQGYYTKHYAVEAWNTRAMISAAPKPDCVGVDEIRNALNGNGKVTFYSHRKRVEMDEDLYDTLCEASRKYLAGERLLAVKEKT